MVAVLEGRHVIHPASPRLPYNGKPCGALPWELHPIGASIGASPLRYMVGAAVWDTVLLCALLLGLLAVAAVWAAAQSSAL